MEAWQNKILHGQFCHQVTGEVDNGIGSSRVIFSNKTEGFMMAGLVNKFNEK